MTSDLMALAWLRDTLEKNQARPIREPYATPTECAAEVGVHPTTILRWEELKRRPRGAAAVRYARLLQEFAAMQRAA